MTTQSQQQSSKCLHVLQPEQVECWTNTFYTGYKDKFMKMNNITLLTTKKYYFVVRNLLESSLLSIEKMWSLDQKKSIRSIN
jgi:hypothetical protein